MSPIQNTLPNIYVCVLSKYSNWINLSSQLIFQRITIRRQLLTTQNPV